MYPVPVQVFRICFVRRPCRKPHGRTFSWKRKVFMNMHGISEMPTHTHTSIQMSPNCLYAKYNLFHISRTTWALFHKHYRLTIVSHTKIDNYNLQVAGNALHKKIVRQVNFEIIEAGENPMRLKTSSQFCF